MSDFKDSSLSPKRVPQHSAKGLIFYRFVAAVVGVGLILYSSGCLWNWAVVPATIMPETSDISSVPIEVHLSVPPTPASNLGSTVIRVTITNNSPHPVYILSWSTPLDRRAVITGQFQFISTTTNDPAPCPNMKINRRMPDSFLSNDDAIFEVPAKGSIVKDVVAAEPEVALTKGDRYRVKTEGWWMRFWVYDGEKEDPVRLVVEDGKSGDFLSNEIEVDVLDA